MCEIPQPLLIGSIDLAFSLDFLTVINLFVIIYT